MSVTFLLLNIYCSNFRHIFPMSLENKPFREISHSPMSRNFLECLKIQEKIVPLCHRSVSHTIWSYGLPSSDAFWRSNGYFLTKSTLMLLPLVIQCSLSLELLYPTMNMHAWWHFVMVIVFAELTGGTPIRFFHVFLSTREKFSAHG